MTEFLQALKGDLLDRRLAPLIALVCVALVGAIGYAVFGGGGSGSGAGSPSATSSPSAQGRGIAVSEAQSGTAGAVAETTNGASAQRHGASRDPFVPLPSATATKASTTGTSKTSSSSSSSSGSSTASGGSGSAGKGESSPTSHPSPKPKPKPKTLYSVAIELGPLPEGATQGTALQPYEGLSKPTFLPSTNEKLIQFVGVTVTGTGKSASFTLAGEAILHGEATCLPSPTQCSMIDLKEGKAEQLEVFTAAGKTVTYELRVVSITSKTASSAAVKSVLRAQSKVAGPLLSAGGALKLAGMRYGSQAGVIVFAGHHAFGARARGASHR
jgi:hypothetical protein